MKPRTEKLALMVAGDDLMMVDMSVDVADFAMESFLMRRIYLSFIIQENRTSSGVRT